MIRHLGLKAYGKINLGLDVLKKREDGYHEVRMIMQTVGLYDKIDLYLKETPGIEVETNLFYLPVNENNLVYKAAKLLMDEFDVHHGVAIHLKKMCIRDSFLPADDGHYLAVMRDTSREHHMRSDLAAALLQSQENNRARTAFFSSMSHDIRTPMNGIIGMTAIAQANLDNREKMENCLNKISVASEHLLALINEVLDMSRIESGKLSLK